MKHIKFSLTPFIYISTLAVLLFGFADSAQGWGILTGCGCGYDACYPCNNHCTYCDSCDCDVCPCPTCVKCTECEPCDCGDCPGDCLGAVCSGCPACGTCTHTPECEDTSGDCLCEACGLDSCIPDAEGLCMECGEPLPQSRLDKLKSNFAKYKQRNPGHASMSWNEYLALRAAHADSACGGSFDQYLNGYITYESFMTICAALDIKCPISMNAYIGRYVESTRDPISVITGELYFTETDIALALPGVPLVYERHYSSITGWRHSLDWELKVFIDEKTNSRSVRQLAGFETWRGIGNLLFTNNLAEIEEDLKRVMVKTGDGADYVFEMSDTEPGVFHSDSVDWKGVCEPIIENSETNGFLFVLHQPGGAVYSFRDDRLGSMEDAWGNRIDLTYTSNTLLAAHNCGTTLLLEHEGNPKSPTRAYVSDDLYIDYTYNEAGGLSNTVRYIDGETFEFTYQYDADGVMTNKTNPRSDEYQFTHNLTTDSDSFSADNTRTTTLEIGDGWMKHQVVANWGYEKVGLNTNEYRYSDVAYDYGNGPERKFHYETEDGLIREKYGPYTNATGVVTDRGIAYTYEDKNLIAEKTFDIPLGESYTVHRQFDTNNQITAMGVSYNTTNPVWQTHIAYDPVWQLPSSVTNAEGHWAQTTYTNGSPLVVKTFWSDSQSFDTTFGYYTNGLVKTITNANEHSSYMEYDANGNPSLVVPPAGPQIATVFSALAHLERSEVLAENGASTGRITEYDVNAKGWINSVTHPDGLGETFAYDKAGSVTNTTDRAGRSTHFTYAPTQKMTSMTRYLCEGGSNTPVRISYDCDKMFTALKITEPRGRYVESYQLDLQDRVTSVTNIEGQAMSIDYGVGSFVKEMVRFDGSSISNEYDQAGRVATTTYRTAGVPPATVAYDYYPDGEIKTISDDLSSSANTYDRLNRLTSATSSVSSVSSVVNYQYDPVGNLTNSVVSAGGAQVSATSYTYDEAERLKEISTGDAGDYEYAYNPTNGRVATVSNTVSGIITSYAYDLLDRATNIAYRTSSGSLIRSLDYEYDAVSMIKKKTINGGSSSTSTAYMYDSIDRLVSEAHSGSVSSLYSVVYQYDLAGNRLSKTSNGWKTSYALGIGNRLASSSTTSNATLFVTGISDELIGTDSRWGELWITNLTAGAGGVPSVNSSSFFAELPALGNATNRIKVALCDRAGNMGYATKDYWAGTTVGANSSSSYEYDAAGCLTNLNGMSLEWDERYRLKTVGNAVQYSYDALDRRISRIEGTTTNNYFVYNGQQVVADLDGNGDLLKTYVWGTGIDNLLSFTDHTASNTYYAIKDYQNTVLALVDELGAVVESYEYSAFGETKVFNATGVELSESALGNRYTFQGREIDWATGLIYFRARWYDPGTGRWLSKDPIGISGGLNLYEFCSNNPVNFIDPFGLAPGDNYQTQDEAAIAASQEIFGQSVEYGGWVYQTSEGYSYTEAVTDGKETTISYRTLNRAEPQGSVAWYHNHPSGHSGGEKFSGIHGQKLRGGDKGYSGLKNKDAYVVTPSGKVKLYRPGLTRDNEKTVGCVKE